MLSVPSQLDLTGVKNLALYVFCSPHLTYLIPSALPDALVRSDAPAAPGLSIHSLFSNQTKKPIN